MPLDKVILDHLEKQDVLENRIEEEIESMLASIKIVDLISNPEELLIAFVEELQKRLKDGYYHTASENGLKLAEDIVKDGDVKVTDSNDPNLNEGIVSDVQGES